MSANANRGQKFSFWTCSTVQHVDCLHYENPYSFCSAIFGQNYSTGLKPFRQGPKSLYFIGSFTVFENTQKCFIFISQTFVKSNILALKFKIQGSLKKRELASLAMRLFPVFSNTMNLSFLPTEIAINRIKKNLGLFKMRGLRTWLSQEMFVNPEGNQMKMVRFDGIKDLVALYVKQLRAKIMMRNNARRCSRFYGCFAD